MLKVFSSISGLEKYPLYRFKNNIVIYDDKIELEKTHNLIKSNFSTEEIMKQLVVSKKDLNLYFKKGKQKNPDYNKENEKNLTELNLIKLLKSFQKSIS
ncbi:hypothetical protein ACS6Y2_03245 [Streptococcus suis]|uniref:hypothetical protein n=1 Tax=Streptococcus suis TaxID=1307 RepID=UPI001EEF9CA3|nr:hypothetical protein [Streptococcus suis]